MESKRVWWLPLVHEHVMMPWKSMRRGDCCRRYEATYDGFYCEMCDFFVHKKCSESSLYIKHPSHPGHILELQRNKEKICNLCGFGVELFYHCEECNFDMDLYCVSNPPPDVIDISETHHHKLILLKKPINFSCDAKCGNHGYMYGITYQCYECDLKFHKDCVWHPPDVKHESEVKHPYHYLHPLKLLTGKPPDYSDGRCSLCKTEIDVLFYHCSFCNFTLDIPCVLNSPPKSLVNLKAHAHQLTLLPRLDSFTCNACGLKGDRSPDACFQCGFMIHRDCLDLPRVININRHDHRVSRTSVLSVVNSVCGVCRQKVDWTYGGYSCQSCPNYVVHSKCATRHDVWNGEELEGVPEEVEDLEPYVVIDENTIQHFIHKEHYLRLNGNGLLWEEKMRCRACCHPIGLQSFYGCTDCDFFLHRKCAELPKKKRHVLHNERLTLVTSKSSCFRCNACHEDCTGFVYEDGDKKLDVRCASVSDHLVHPSHPHPLYYVLVKREEHHNYLTDRACYGCGYEDTQVFRCIEDGCKFILGFKCATLPEMVKHRVEDHPLSLCYVEKEANGRQWCDICESESDPTEWNYTSKDHRGSLHTKCVLGDFSQLMPRSTIYSLDIPRIIRSSTINWSYQVVLNDFITRPYCLICCLRCMYPIMLKCIGTSDTYVCCDRCLSVSQERLITGKLG